MKTRSMLSILLSLVLAVGLLAGCGTPNNPPASSTDIPSAETPAADSTAGSAPATDTPAPSGDAVLLRVWGGVPPESGPDASCQLFNQAFADQGIQVEYERFVNDETGNLKLETSLLAGNDVDLYMTYGISELQKRSSGNMALDLSELIARDGFDITGIFGSIAESYYIDGKPYSLPTKLDQYGIVINKTMFDEAGIDIPTEWTVDEFREIALQLTHGEGQDKVYGMFWNSQQDMGYPLTYISVQTLGGDPLYADENTPDVANAVNIAAVSLINNMMNVDGSSPTHVDSVTQKLSQEGMFLTGRSAMTVGPWMVRSIKDKEQYPHDFETAFAPYPVVEAGQRNYTQGGYGDHLCINPKSANLDAAWEYAKWYATEGMLPVVEGGRVPSANTYNPDEVTAAFLKGAEDHIHAESTKRILIVQAENYAVPSITNKLPEINKKLTEELEAIYTGQKTVEEGLQEVQTFAEAQLS